MIQSFTEINRTKNVEFLRDSIIVEIFGKFSFAYFENYTF